MDVEMRLIQAAQFIKQGEGFYRKAADEIIAAQAEDPSLGFARIGDRVGKSKDWCRRLVQWRTNGEPGDTPFVEGEAKTDRNELASARKVLRERPEVVADAIAQAPPEVQARIAAALPAPPAPSAPAPVPEGTAADYMRDPAPDPSDREIDHLAMQAARTVRDMRDRVRNLGVWTMGELADTLRDLDCLIDDAGEVRAAVRETLNERALQ